MLYNYIKITSHLVPGSKVLVRCVKLLKPYIKKNVANDEEEEGEEDEDEDEDYSGVRRTAPSMGRIMERDLISQAYDISRFEHGFPSVRKLKTETKQRFIQVVNTSKKQEI